MDIFKLIDAAVEYDKGDAKRINHFMKVYEFARLIGHFEGLDKNEQEILEMAAVLHDIGIHNAEKLHGSSSGQYQELEGPAVAREILQKLDCTEESIAAVCDMVGRHHTYTSIDSIRLQILIEADFIVNIYEDNMNQSSINSVKSKIFKTEYGKRLLDNIFKEGVI